MHQSVLLNETIEGLGLNSKRGKKLIVVDATFGGGGHTLAISKRYPGARIIALDQDESTWRNTEDKFKNSGCQISFVNENFRNLGQVLKKEKVEEAGGVDGIIFDLGLSSDQLERSGRGFSFKGEEPLLMTMKENPRPEDLTAEEVVNTWSEENLAAVIGGYGEERFAKKIAKAIVRERENRPLRTTSDLVGVISRAVPAAYRRGRISRKLHEATRTFQAIRIAVNDELGALSLGLKQGFDFLKDGGRIAVISFHSLEDRIVKKFFKGLESLGEAKIINKKVILAGEEEIKENPRSRSAKLRIVEKI